MLVVEADSIAERAILLDDPYAKVALYATVEVPWVWGLGNLDDNR